MINKTNTPAIVDVDKPSKGNVKPYKLSYGTGNVEGNMAKD